MKIEEIAYKKGYRVTENGLFLNPKGKVIGTLNRKNYTVTCLRINKKLKHLKAHRLQAFQKYSFNLYNEGIEVRHKNGDPLNNSWNNILIGTSSENKLDIPKQVRIKRAQHAASFKKKYNNEDVIAYHNKIKSYKATMLKFDISSKGTLHYILNNSLVI